MDLRKTVRNVRDQAKQKIIRKIRSLYVKREPLNASAAKRNHPELLKAVYGIRRFWGWEQALEDVGMPGTWI